MKKAVVTGANGFIGTALTRELSGRGVEVLAVVRGAQSRTEEIERLPGVRVVYCDLADIASLPERISDRDADCFFHLAWEGSAGAARADYALQMRNALQSVETLKAAKALGCKRAVCAGSIMEYEVESAVHGQGTRPGTAYFYGIGKQAAHGMCKVAAAELGLDLLWPMITNAYGAGERSPRMLNTTLRKVLRGEPLQFTAATQNYDFVYITDAARAFALIGEKGVPFCEYMVGSGQARPLKEFLLELRQAVAPDTEMQFGTVPFTGVDLDRSIFSTRPLETDCGYRPEVPFAEGVRKTMEWLREQRE